MAEAIEFRCPRCGKLLRTDSGNAGRPAACPGCGDRVAVPKVCEATESADATPAPTKAANADRVVPRTVHPHRGGLILAFGILSWATTCFLFGVAAWALGVEDLRAMRAGEMDASGDGLTRAGMIIGAINVVLTLVVLLGVVGLGALALVFS